jgi:hypothetical protein
MKVLVDITEYRDLKEAALLLRCLEDAGVDNWDGYSYAYAEFDEILKESNTKINESL